MASAPYWGQLPGSQGDGQSSRTRRPSADASTAPVDDRQSFDTSAQLQPKPNPHRASVQTTYTEAPSESTMSPFASPLLTPALPVSGLAPRPPSLPYGANLYPPQDSAANRSRRHNERIRAASSEQYDYYTPPTPRQAPSSDPNGPSLLPASADVSRGPPSNYRHPQSHSYASSGAGQPPRAWHQPELSLAAEPMDLDSPEQYYMTAAGAPPEVAQIRDDRPRVLAEPNVASRVRRGSVSVGSGSRQRPVFTSEALAGAGVQAGASPTRIEPGTLPRRMSTSGNSPSERRKLMDDLRSPLQKLELTLDSITKEEKRARVAAAEQQLARDREARKGNADRPSTLQPQTQPPPQSQPQSQLQPQAQLQPRVQPPVQQVRFREVTVASASAATTVRDDEPRPLLQPDYSPVEDSFLPASTGQGSPTSERPFVGARNPALPAGTASGIPQRNLSFREHAARTDARLPHTEDLASELPQDGPSVKRNGSTKLKKEPPADLWHKRIDTERMHSIVQPRNGPAAGAHDYAGNTVTRSGSNSANYVYAAPQLQAVDLHRQRDTQPTQQRQAAKLTKSPSQRQTATAGRNTGLAPAATFVNARDVDGTYEMAQPHSLAPVTAAVVGGAVGAGAAANAAPKRRTARFLDDVETHEFEDDRHFDETHHHHISNMIYNAREKMIPGHGIYKPPVFLEEWRKGTVGTLSGAMFDLSNKPEPEPEKEQAWWEQGSKRRGSTSSARPRKAEAFDGEYDGTNGPTRFKPPLQLVCGPLLRYCGTRKERPQARNNTYGNGNSIGNNNANSAVPPPEREYWRGSVMIVTLDSDSSYDIAPTLRLFAQPLELLPPPPTEVKGSLPPEYVDPLVGHPKLGRNGETLYVRPVEHLDEAKDLSQIEQDDGLFEKKKCPIDGANSVDTDSPGSFASRLKRTVVDGEKAGKFKDVRGFRLHAERGVTFWRFNIEVELQDSQQRIAYRINRGPSTGFWVPSKHEPMHIMFHTCNGFSLGVDTSQFSGPDPLWRDVLNNHQTKPFHVMIGGGDQIYNDVIMQQSKIFQEWLMIKNPIAKHNAAFTAEMQDEMEEFYLNRYAMWFSQGLFGLANSQIPMVNMYDDHDIIDGFGSYPHHLMNSPVFSGLGNVAFKYYMLFQHQSVIGETEEFEPSWIIGAKPGPYIEQQSRSLFMSLGAKVSLLAVDCRTERRRDEVIYEDTWKRIIDRCYDDIEKGKTEHLLVLLGVPIAYPRLVWLENILTSRLMDPIKALGKTGILGKFLNRFDGGVEVLDDLDDHWTAKNHKDERKVVIEDLQDLAADKSIRITIISGDVHLGAIGQFYSNSKLGLAKHKDFRYMPNVISSAIANTPPPDLLADVLNKRNKIHHFDDETDEDMIPMFAHGVDGKPRNNKRLLPHRNWCSIQAYVPGSTPASTPAHSSNDLASMTTPMSSRVSVRLRQSFRRRGRGPYDSGDPSRPPVSGGILRTMSRGRMSSESVRQNRPGTSVKRSLSLSGNILRRLSFRREKKSDDGGINGSWGPESEENVSMDMAPPRPLQQSHAAPPPVPPKDSLTGLGKYNQQQNYGYGRSPAGTGAGAGAGTVGSAANRQNFAAARAADDYYSDESSEEEIPGHARGVHIRGGAGTPTDIAARSYEEFGHGDESFFTVKPRVPPPQQSRAAPEMVGQVTTGSSGMLDTDAPPPPRAFFRTPTGLSAKQMKHAKDFEVNLEGGLDIRLNVEVNPRDPSGITVPYRLVVPRLWYQYQGEDAAAGAARPASQKGIKRWLSMGKKRPSLERPPNTEMEQEA